MAAVQQSVLALPDFDVSEVRDGFYLSYRCSSALRVEGQDFGVPNIQEPRSCPLLR